MVKKFFVFLVLLVVLIVVVAGGALGVLLVSHGGERISFLNFNPKYRLVVNEAIVGEVMDMSDEGLPTTWGALGNKNAARKVWVIVVPGAVKSYDGGTKRNGDSEYTYSHQWIDKGANSFLVIRVNDRQWQYADEKSRFQMLDWEIFPVIARKYPSGGITESEVEERVGKMYLEAPTMPVEIYKR